MTKTALDNVLLLFYFSGTSLREKTMSGIEWFFAVLSGILMITSLWVRVQEDRAACLSRPQSSQRVYR